MGFAVCNGAACSCTFGAAPCTIIVTPKNKVIGNNMSLANIQDNTTANIPTFGVCNSMANPAVASATAAALGVLTPQPCSPVTPSPWAPGCPTVLIANVPALTDSSMLTCVYGGMIKISNPGQQTILLP